MLFYKLHEGETLEMSLSKEAKTLREWTGWCHDEAVRQAKEHKFKEIASIELVALDVAQRILDTEVASHIDRFAKERLEIKQKLQQFPYLKCQKVKIVDADDHCSDADCAHYRSCNWFWIVFRELLKE